MLIVRLAARLLSITAFAAASSAAAQAATVAPSGAPSSPPRPTYEIDVTVDVPARSLIGSARVTVPNSSDTPLTDLYFWRYPERLAHRSPALNDYNFYWIYPRRFTPGGMRTGAVTVEGRPASSEPVDHRLAGPGTLLRVHLPQPIPPRGQAVVQIPFSVQVPVRYGGFGCVDDRCTLAGGFYPMLAATFRADQATSAAPPPERAVYRLTVRVPRVSDVIVNGSFFPVARDGVLTVDVGEAQAAALIVGKPAFRHLEELHRGVHIHLFTASPPALPSPKDFVLPYQPADRAARMMAAAAEAIDLLAELGEPLPSGDRLTIVEGPLHVELAQAHPGFVLVSDELFDIFPLGRFLKFHEFQLVRALYQEIFERRVAPHEPPSDVSWSPEVSAAYLGDIYTLRAYRREEFARQILSWASFIPAIDRILYAPQVPYASAYFYTLEDPDPLRDSLAEFANDWPRGKLIYSKLRDLFGTEAMDRLMRLELAGMPAREAAERVRGGNLDWFWKQWLGPYPPVDYRFVDVRTVHSRGRYVTTATVEKFGDHPPREPVEVRARARDGVELTGSWDGAGRRHIYEFDMGAQLANIEIDPRGRLVEDLPGSNDDLRFDDRRPARWKFVYNNFGGLVNFQTLAVDLSVDFSLSRILDLKNAMRFLIFRDESTQVGASASYTRYFGRKVTQARLASHVTTALTAARMEPTFGKAIGAREVPGTQLTLVAGYSHDDRLYIWEPRRARSWYASASMVETVLDSAEVLSQGTVTAGLETILPLADGHGLAMSVDSGVTFGDLRIARQMLASGAPGGARGYEPDELLGRAQLILRAEYRHVFVHDLHWNLLHTLYVRGLGGGLFAEGALTSACDSYAVSSKSLATDVGYSLRLFGDWFGVSQTTLNFDIAVPLVRRDLSCFGPLAPARARAPVGFFVSFAPPW